MAINELYIYTNGVLISRRLITKESGEAITPSDIASVTLNVYKLTLDDVGVYKRTKIHTASITPSDIVTAQVETDVYGLEYNFNYCAEGVFTIPNTLYLVEYILVDVFGHNIVVTAKGRTQD